MDNRLRDVLENRASTEYILPFFWQHGEEHEVLLRELDAIQNSGINEFCVESRVHEQFGEDKWWEDMGFLLKEARKRGMRVWLLDDKSFPTGYANNYIASHPELRTVRARIEPRDFVGPVRDTALVPTVLFGKEEKLITAVAYRREREGNTVTGEGINLMPLMKDGLIWWDIPEGNWRVYYVIRTYMSPLERKRNYIDMMSEESCKAMLHAVYEPHYEHFKEYFGNTFAGFFSDEPGFGNEGGTYHSVLGRENHIIPWRDDLPGLMAEKMHCDPQTAVNLLPALWHEIEGKTALVRECYMETATEQFSRNFSWMLGDWCRARGVKYIGHVIEDDNAHQRLGHGCGHYFRALAGQDMGGIDIVLHQYIPGMTDMEHMAWLEEKRADPAFFSYTLPKLASSHAHIQPLKQGRAVCEIYGGFGWAEGIPEMKQMTDLMLVGGVNYFVPHAFNAKYPDLDHPPHFYAQGNNYQYPVFGQLMGYARRMCHVLSGGVHQADAAVYYNAEAEWSGGRNQLVQEVCRLFGKNQVEFDIIPQDTVLEDMTVRDGRAVVNGVEFGVLVVPYSQYLPERVLKAFAALAAREVPVWFVNAIPDASTEGGETEELLGGCSAVPFGELIAAMEKNGLKRVRLSEAQPSLRYYHTKRDGSDFIMLWNESIVKEVDTMLTIPASGTAVFYDGWKNQVRRAGRRGQEVRVRLAPAQSVVLAFGDWGTDYPEYDYRDKTLRTVELSWKLSRKGREDADFVPCGEIRDLRNLARELPRFGGILRYETELEAGDSDEVTVMEFENVGEIASLWVNDQYCGTVVEKPYRFELKGLKPGTNHIRAEVMTNIAYREIDRLSSYIPLPISGLGGEVRIG